MFTKIDNKAKLNAFKPVRVPRTKDVFRRMGYRRLPNSQDSQVAYFSRNPLDHCDECNRNFDEYAYQQYVEQMKREADSQNANSQSETESTVDE